MNAVSPATPESGTHALPALDLPRTFGAYTLFELIGKGGMAQIYLARAETELGATRLAVVKQILPTFADDPRFAEMLIHEAKLAAPLSHRHIVQVFELGKADDGLFIAMEYVEGFDLNALLRQCTESSVGLPAPHALGIVVDVLDGLDYAHRAGIVHRDVSPSNVLISYEGEVKLCDFGIAHANELVRAGASSEALKGKAGYMSPEHARGEALDARADVFAAGIILWELLAGKRLYKPRGETPLLDQARAAEIPPLPDKGLPAHARLEAIVRKALARDRDARWPSAAAFARELEQYLADVNMLASRLKLGEWIASTFGTKLIEDRRASERRLPKSERVRKSSPAIEVATPRIPPPPAVPSGLAMAVPTHSDGAMKAFKRELVATPESLAAMDVSPPSRTSIEPGAPSSRAISAAAPSRARALLVVAVVALAVGLGLVALARMIVQ